jgi:carbon storage regulator
MLALSRKLSESVIIGGNIEVTILEIKGDQVKVGINAPRNLQIYRKEIYTQIQEENKQSAGKQGRVEDIKKLFG